MAYLWVKGTGNQLWNPPENPLGRWAEERSPGPRAREGKDLWAGGCWASFVSFDPQLQGHGSLS